ncbi:MAG TPA: hypothetical protein VFO52_04240 [Longimicrobiales bacterium]|nr:hypothetical protein [Longimicrobiales bacterium]
MILHCTFEELSAMSAGAERVLAEVGSGASVVIAPPEIAADVEALLPRLTGDLSVSTLSEQQRIARAVTYIVAELKQRMDAVIVDEHPAAEYAVGAYFDYAHALSVQDRVVRLGAEMSAIIEVMTGRAPTAEIAREFTFPDA